MSHLVAPSVLSADFANIQRDVEMINSSKADWFHVDIMDGVFVPNISFGFPVVKAIKKHATKPLDVHLMIVDPDRYVTQFRDAGADVLTVHFEACTHLHRSIGAIKECGMKAGVALNPHTPVAFLNDILSEVDLVCLMSVNPGFGGQKFIQHTYKKINDLVQLRERLETDCHIEIDGGVAMSNYGHLLNAGANVLVAGNTVFSSENPTETISKLKAYNRI
jgi:ribulose-phosphate 3-epimerase